MKRSNSVADALNVQRELANVRGEIEQIEGRKRFLENQTSLSTIKVLIKTPTAFSGNSGGFFYRLKEAFGDRIRRGFERFVFPDYGGYRSCSVFHHYCFAALSFVTILVAKRPPTANGDGNRAGRNRRKITKITKKNKRENNGKIISDVGGGFYRNRRLFFVAVAIMTRFLSVRCLSARFVFF